VLSATIVLIAGVGHGITTGQPFVLVSLRLLHGLEDVAEQFAFTLNTYPVHTCRPLITALVPLMFTAVQTLVLLTGVVVYSTVKLPPEFEDDQASAT
jgi:hypothetical protein